MEYIDFQDFKKVDIRTGKIIDVEEFPNADNACYRTDRRQ